MGESTWYQDVKSYIFAPMLTKEPFSMQKFTRSGEFFFRLRCLALFVFLIVISARPLLLPNWWLHSGVFREIDASWLTMKCGLRFDQQFVDLERVFSHRPLGGHYENLNCKFVQEIAIIVPYRNRVEQMNKFVDYMHRFLLTQNAVSYRIYFIEQADNGPFNRGALLNIGFVNALRDNPKLNCFIFHDVDILPTDFRQFYTCSKRPRHFCSYLDTLRFILMYDTLFGGVVGMNRQRFTEVNGYSNEFRGWGGEDDDFYTRIAHKNHYIERYDSEVGRCRMLSHPHNREESKDRYKLLQNTLERMPQDGLSNVDTVHTVIEREHLRLYTKIRIEFHTNQTKI